MKQMQSRLRQEDDRIKMSGEVLGDEDMTGLDVVEDAEESESEEEDDEEEDEEETNPAQRPRGKFRQGKIVLQMSSHVSQMDTVL